jgi:CheY-like chemotaxis protein
MPPFPKPVHWENLSMKILVIDDNPAQGDGLAELFRHHGHKADWTICLTGAQALSSLSTYDVVVTDLIVKCISPRELLEGIEHLPGHPALVVLAPVPSNHPSLADIPPHARVLFEPTDPDEIVSTVESFTSTVVESTGAR